MKTSMDQAARKLADWQTSMTELSALEAQLGTAMTDYARTLGEPPRALIIEAERKREETQRLFDLAMAALDAHSVARTGHTNFGGLT